MADAELITPPAVRGNLGSRIIVGLFLAVVAMADIWIGGPAFAAMVALAVALIFWEWGAMHQTPRDFRIVGVLGLLASALASAMGRPLHAAILLFVLVGLMIAASLLIRRPGKRWLSTGLLYAGVPSIALIWMREHHDGLLLVIWTMGLVWTTDTFAYFVGRTIGGPKLMVSVSPNKTWAGLIGGVIFAGLFSALFGYFSSWPQPLLLMFMIGGVLAVVAQAGDLFESWLKRRAGVKDSGRLLPGHGGIMDRVDGLVPVACVVAAWVAVR